VDQSTLVIGKVIMNMVVAKWSMQTAISMMEIGKMVSPKRRRDNGGQAGEWHFQSKTIINHGQEVGVVAAQQHLWKKNVGMTEA
jgi:hypothetical protein